MKRAWIAVAAASALLLTACGDGGESTPTDGASAIINVGSVYEPQNLDNTAGGGQASPRRSTATSTRDCSG